MKYVTFCIAGLSDRPAADLDGLTPLQAADTPTLDRLADMGKISRCRTLAQGASVDGPEPLFSILGFDGRKQPVIDPGPIEALGAGLEAPIHARIMRCDMLSVDPASGEVHDHTQAGLSVTPAEFSTLTNALDDMLTGEGLVDPDDLQFVCRIHEVPLLVSMSDADDASGSDVTPPAALIGRSLGRHRPSRRNSASNRLATLISLSEQVFSNHEVNEARESVGLRPITHLWPWGGGLMPDVLHSGRAFAQQHRLSGCMVSASSQALGVAHRLGMPAIPAEPQTSATGGQAGGQPQPLLDAVNREIDALAGAVDTGRAIEAHDVTVIYVSGIDRLSLAGDFQQKVQAIESLDRHLIRHIVDDRLIPAYSDDWRLSLIPVHGSDTAARTRLLDWVPTLIAGKDVSSLVSRTFNEQEAAESDLFVETGHDWMEYFLYGGLTGR
ncbi:MAG: hypothetical protein HND57_10585 [Planctomycetes bacterium]|nr:hypothetical protein [Planctomycetota bacterium]